MFNDNKIRISINPSNLVAPVRVNAKLLSINNNQNKTKISTLEHEEYNFRSDDFVNKLYESNDRMIKKYRTKYIFEDDIVYEEKCIINSLLPRIFYRKYGKK